MTPDCQKCRKSECENYGLVKKPVVCDSFALKTLDDAFDEPLKTVDEYWKSMATVPKVKYDFDKVQKPSHYVKNGFECIDIIKVMTKGMDGYEGYLVGNIIKYLFRCDAKNGLEDVRKANKYIEFLIKEKESK